MAATSTPKPRSPIARTPGRSSMNHLAKLIRRMSRDVILFTRHGSGVNLRDYQEKVARAIVESVIFGDGLTFVVVFPRQSGKNELQAHIECYLLALTHQTGAEMVKVSPTWKPQSLNAILRLERVLERNLVCRELWKKEHGYIYRLGAAKIVFLSGALASNVVGATASSLLQCDEAQDVLTSKWDKDFAPMAAATNATTVFWGTAWTGHTLLARELRVAREAQKKDGIRRVFYLTAQEVAQEVPSYGHYVAGQIAKLGRNHPLVKTQYFSEEIDAQAGMFPAERQSLMKGDHPRRREPRDDSAHYVFLIDVAGEDEGAVDVISELEKGKLRNPARNVTALTIVEVDISTLSDDLVKAPTYRVQDRRAWTGVPHTTIFRDINELAELWRPRFTIVDATGVGTGLASFLVRAMRRGTVRPYVFTPKTKSDLGWNFLAVCDTGRFKDHHGPQGSPEYNEFWNQLQYVQYEALENQTLRWSVPDGTRDLSTGELVHDDWVLSAALCALLDEEDWYVHGPTFIIRPPDPLLGMDRNY